MSALKPPLAGVTVIDLTRALAGPYSTMLLGDLGARIIKVEPPAEPDTTRTLVPKMGPSMSVYFAAVNRNKECISLDIKRPEGLKIFEALVARSDVVMDNFRPGTLARLGVDYEELRGRVNPGLVSCSITGFGATGEYAERSSFDLVVQAISGAMSVTGEPGGRPVRLGLPIGDLGAGMFAGFGIAAALHARHESGLGRHVEVSMFDTMVSLQSYLATLYLQTGLVPGPQGSGHEVNVPYQAFETGTGWIVIAIFGDRFWKELCEVLGLEDMANDSRYTTAGERTRRRREVLDRIEPILKSGPAEMWIERMLAKRIPCAPINTIDKALDDPVIRARHMVVETEHPAYGKAAAPGNPMKVDGIRDGTARPPSLHGEHNAAILREFVGAGDDDIARFRRDGVIS